MVKCAVNLSQKWTCRLRFRTFLIHITAIISKFVVEIKQEASLKKIIVEGYRAVGSNDSYQSSNFLLLLLLFFIDFGQW